MHHGGFDLVMEGPVRERQYLGRIELDGLPGKNLAGNTRCDHFTYQREFDALKTDAYWAMKKAKITKAQDRIETQVTFVVPNDRRLDEDNMMFGLKAVWDALVEYKAIPDDCWKNLTHGRPSFVIARQRKRAKVVIDFWEGEPLNQEIINGVSKPERLK